jgi:hypothetical protein
MPLLPLLDGFHPLHYTPTGRPNREIRMKRALVLLTLGLVGCSSVESATVSSTEVTAVGGDAVAVVQADALGFTLFGHLVDAVNSDLDVAVNRLLVTEAKAMGASKVDLKDFSTTPRHGVYAVINPFACFPIFTLFCFPSSRAQGLAVK